MIGYIHEDVIVMSSSYEGGSGQAICNEVSSDWGRSIRDEVLNRQHEVIRDYVRDELLRYIMCIRDEGIWMYVISMTLCEVLMVYEH